MGHAADSGQAIALLYRTNSATAEGIARHLLGCDAEFVSALGARTDIAAYAGKLVERALRFEAWAGGTLVGLVAAYAGQEGEGAYITNVSVLPGWQRRGIGTRLMRDCLAHARRGGLPLVRLELRAGNRAALKLYEGLGFCADDPGEQTLRMRLELRGENPMQKSTNAEAFMLDIDLKGWRLFEQAIQPDLAERMNYDCLQWIKLCNRMQVEGGISTIGDDTGHHTLGRGDSLDEFIELHPLHAFINAYFRSRPYILHAFNPVAGAPRAASYVHRIHRDARSYLPGIGLKLNMLVMLDDFTLENGATQVLEGSHKLAERPSDEYFAANFKSLTAARGSVVLFNSYLWHRAGFNATDRNRVALTVGFSLPFVKPQLDYARMLGPDHPLAASALTRQVLGYNSMTPISLEEWYRPEATRLYKANQG